MQATGDIEEFVEDVHKLLQYDFEPRSPAADTSAEMLSSVSAMIT